MSVRLVAVKNVEGSKKINFLALYINLLADFEKTINAAEQILTYSHHHINADAKHKKDMLAIGYLNARTTFLYDKIENGGTPLVSQRVYQSVKNEINNYVSPYLTDSLIKAAKLKLESLKKVKHVNIDQPFVNAVIEQVEHYVQNLSIYFVDNPQKVADAKSTESLRKKIIAAIAQLEYNGLWREIKDVRSLNQEELVKIMQDGAVRLNQAIEQAKTNIAEAKSSFSSESCDIVSHNVGVLWANLQVLRFSGVEYDEDTFNSYLIKLNANKVTALKLVRQKTIDGAEWALKDVNKALESNMVLDDETALGFITRMQAHRKWLKYYNSAENLVEEMQNFGANAGIYQQGSRIHSEVMTFVEKFLQKAVA